MKDKKVILGDNIKEISGFQQHKRLKRPLLGANIAAGFPSPAQDYIEKTIDLNEQLISHPVATFFIRVEGDSMIGAGIFPDDVLIVDRALNAADGNVIVAVLNSELTVKRLKISAKYWSLHPENPAYPEIIITEDTDFSVWGVVTYCIHKL
ncbi:MAG: translesion error-prone DNA polymerase V autoproteolytic subunit [Candidatus Cloacimonetes bacterium]|nr:translesion error-prone DNA polymerase V autoproteolytic subunit [Candidatus Cloacimonadota bacterium]